MALANSHTDRMAVKLSDAREVFKWYSLQIPELASLQPRVGHSLVSLKDGEVLMIGGGNHNGALSEVISIRLEPDTKNGNKTRVSHHPASHSFPARYEFLCAKDNVRNCAWIFGGADQESTKNDVLKIDDGTIEIISLEKTNEVLPCPRTQGNSSTLLEFKKKLYIAVFAGGLKGEQPVQDVDLYLFDTEEHLWEKVITKPRKTTTIAPFSSQPPLVQGHAMTAIGSKIFMHGGINNTTLYDDLYWLDLEKERENLSYTWLGLDNPLDMSSLSSSRPSGRAAHGIARIMDVQKNSPLFYMFGGVGEKGAFNDLWSFNVDSMCWTEIIKNQETDSSSYLPVPRLDLAMCAIGLNDTTSNNFSVYIMIHGGMNRNGEIFNDAWIMKIQ